MRIVMLCAALVVFLFTLTADVMPAQDSVSEPTNQKASAAPPRAQYASVIPYQYLEPGFPIKAWYDSGLCSPHIYLTVGNIDADPRLEIFATSLKVGPLNAWHHDGSVVSDWPVQLGGAAYPVLGRMTNYPPALDVFAGYYSGGPQGDMAAYSGDGQLLPGNWPLQSGDRVYYPPSMEDITGDGVFEIFMGELDNKLHAYDPAGNDLPGWPVYVPFVSKFFHTPSFADIDGNGDLEIITTTASHLLAIRPDGTILPWSPVAYAATDVSFGCEFVPT